MSTNVILSTNKLTKKYNNQVAVRNVDLEIYSGDIFALIGPNSAGKTSLIKMLVGLQSISSGSAKILGFDVENQSFEAKRHLGYVPDSPSGFDYLTGQELLHLVGNLKQLSKKTYTEEFEELVGLFPELESLLFQRLENYSRGNRQKISFLAALLGKPKLLLIDEPIVGLDPQSIGIFGKKLQSFVKDGGAVLMTTHIVTFATDFATRAGFMHHGQLSDITNNVSANHLNQTYQKLI